MARPTPVDRERTFGENEIIVSKTDSKGRITYANDVFCRVADYPEAEVIGKPHSFVRHPDMPRVVFKLLWGQIEAKREIFAYVKNMARTGEYYWVFAHVTPSFDAVGNITGYHSNRRAVDRSAIAIIDPLYRALLNEEQRHPSPNEGMRAAEQMLQDALAKQGMIYDEFVQKVGH